MSHRSRWTHDLTAERDEQAGIDEYDSPIYDTTTVVEDAPVRFRDGGTSFVRTETGERVARADTLVGRGRLAESLAEGDRLTLTPRDPDAATIDGVEIAGVTRVHGRSARAGRTIIKLETV